MLLIDDLFIMHKFEEEKRKHTVYKFILVCMYYVENNAFKTHAEELR